MHFRVEQQGWVCCLHHEILARRPAMNALYHQTYLLWCWQHVRWNLNMWRNIMLSDEPRDYLKFGSGEDRWLPAFLNSTPLTSCWISLGVQFEHNLPKKNPTTHWLIFATNAGECDAIQQQCVTKLVTSMGRRSQAVVAMYGSSTCCWGSCLLNE